MNALLVRTGFAAAVLGFVSIVSAYQVKPGDQAPKFSAISMDGKQLFLKDLQNEGPIFLYFMRDGDAVARRETTYIERIVRSYVPSRPNWYGVINGKHDRARSVAAEYNPPFRLLWDENLTAVHAFGVLNSPTVVEISASGKVMNIWRGYSGYRLKGINRAAAAMNHVSPKNLDFSRAPSTTVYGIDY